ncbi:unnamed protein product [Taenia asiatica]|uniref:Ubiquitin-like domain-containing protein n=1 Tax=Taenia asiatica TaxID=60517 RepID=A0A0R3W4U8_TAEAS|nr:unnamed protein product [Taenia asiatica]
MGGKHNHQTVHGPRARSIAKEVYLKLTQPNNSDVQEFAFNVEPIITIANMHVFSSGIKGLDRKKLTLRQLQRHIDAKVMDGLSERLGEAHMEFISKPFTLLILQRPDTMRFSPRLVADLCALAEDPPSIAEMFVVTDCSKDLMDALDMSHIHTVGYDCSLFTFIVLLPIMTSDHLSSTECFCNMVRTSNDEEVSLEVHQTLRFASLLDHLLGTPHVLADRLGLRCIAAKAVRDLPLILGFRICGAVTRSSGKTTLRLHRINALQWLTFLREDHYRSTNFLNKEAIELSRVAKSLNVEITPSPIQISVSSYDSLAIHDIGNDVPIKESLRECEIGNFRVCRGCGNDPIEVHNLGMIPLHDTDAIFLPLQRTKSDPSFDLSTARFARVDQSRKIQGSGPLAMVINFVEQRRFNLVAARMDYLNLAELNCLQSADITNFASENVRHTT